MNSPREVKVAVITGSIGSGKSTVSKIFQELGAVLISADQLARQIVEPKSKALLEIEKSFGQQVISKNGTLNREALSKIVFSDPEKKLILEKITHPLIHKLAIERYQEALNQTPRPDLILHEIPLYFESALHYEHVTHVIAVTSPEDDCIKRVTQRDTLSKQEVQKRFNSQLPQEEKEKRADIVIRNDGTVEELKIKVIKTYNEILMAG